VAIIMDGNGRWAKQRGLPRTAGHTAGEAALFDVIEGAIELGIKNLSAYAFSTENWRRSPEEVRWLMAFNRDVIHRRRDQFVEMGVRVHWVGRRPKLWRSVINELEIAEGMSRGNDLINLYFCVNYGGRAEIVEAARRVMADGVSPDALDEAKFSEYLYTAGQPDPDLLIRTSGEMRVSNFLLWQIAYAEIWVTDTLWPDFRARHLLEAIVAYQKRDRRYGGINQPAVAGR
jgi:undecaprenyl diphosphate synthase